MKNKYTLLAVMLLFIQTVFSQMQPFGHVTVFSEDGDAFYLIINGEQMNDEPETNIRIEELTNPYYHAKVVFQDGSLETINKKYLQISGMDGLLSDMTYIIKRNKKRRGKTRLSLFSATPVVQGYVAPSNVYVRRFGYPMLQVQQPVQPQVQPVVQPVVSQGSTTINNISINTNVNAQGENINVNVQNPIGITNTNQTPIIIGGVGGVGEVLVPEEVYEGCQNAYGMSASNFDSAINTLKRSSFEDAAFKTAKQIALTNCLTVDQIMKICDTFKFEKTKLDFAKYAYNSCTETQNYFRVNDVFSFNNSINELNDFIHGY
ncbi:MAG: DUF4476 domain-containing protein [Xanthomarina sp.]